MNRSEAPEAEVPLEVVTVTSTVPAAPGGRVAVIEVGEVTVKVAGSEGPKSTVDVPVRSVPVMETVGPPEVGPWEGTTEVTVGAFWKV